MEPVRFGVIGCGLMGREFASVSMRWLHLAADLPRPVIVAACDLSDANLGWFRQVPDTKYFYHDYQELLQTPRWRPCTARCPTTCTQRSTAT